MARKQSSIIWFNGKQHKEIWFNGNYHDKMYLTDSKGVASLVWEKKNGRDVVYISPQTYLVGNYIVELGASNKVWLTRKTGYLSGVGSVTNTVYDWDGEQFVEVFNAKNTLRTYDTYKKAGNGKNGVYFANVNSGLYYLYYGYKDGISEIGKITYDGGTETSYQRTKLDDISLSCSDDATFQKLSISAPGFAKVIAVGYTGNVNTLTSDDCYMPIKDSRYLVTGAYSDMISNNLGYPITICNMDKTEIATIQDGNKDIEIIADYEDFIIVRYQIAINNVRHYAIKYIDRKTKEVSDINISNYKKPCLSNVIYHEKNKCYYALGRLDYFEESGIEVLYVSDDGKNYDPICYYSSARLQKSGLNIFYAENAGIMFAKGNNIVLIEEKYL